MANETQTQPGAPETAEHPLHGKSEFELGHDDPSPGPLFAVSIIGVLIVAVVIIGAMGFYLFFERMEIEQKVYMAPHTGYEAYLEEARAMLDDPVEQARFIEDEEEREAAGRRLPIDTALELARASVTDAEHPQTQPSH